MHEFEFLEPETLEQALALLAEHDDDACVFAGGTALLLAMRQRMMVPGVVVSLARVGSLHGISYDPATGLRIGALSRHDDVARSPLVREHYPMLAAMAAGLANPQVRNQATIGGNLCYADPATDPPTCLIAMGAEVTLAGPDGERRLPMRDFCVDFFTTALEPGEILTEIRLPAPRAGTVGLYRRHLRTAAEHRPVANVALTALQQGTGWTDVRLVIGAATPSPQTMTRAAEALTGQTITLALAEKVAALVAEDLDAISDSRGDAAFRRQVVRAATRRIVAEAAGLDWKEHAA